MNIRVGDIVIQNGSAQNMVAEEVCADGKSVVCTWMDSGVVAQKPISVVELRKAKSVPEHKYHNYHQIVPRLARRKA